MRNATKKTGASRGRQNEVTPEEESRAGGLWGDEVRDRLRDLLKQMGYSQYSFAIAIGVDPSRVNEWQAGKYLPGVESLHAFNTNTGMSVDWLLFGVGEPILGQSIPDGDIWRNIAVHARASLMSQVAAMPWAESVRFKPSTDDRLFAQRILDLGVSQVLSEVRDRLFRRAKGEPVRFPADFSMRDLSREAKKALRSQLAKQRLPAPKQWVGFSLQDDAAEANARAETEAPKVNTGEKSVAFLFGRRVTGPVTPAATVRKVAPKKPNSAGKTRGGKGKSQVDLKSY